MSMGYFRKFQRQKYNPRCALSEVLVRTSATFGAHLSYFWCAPKVQMVRTKTSVRADETAPASPGTAHNRLVQSAIACETQSPIS